MRKIVAIIFIFVFVFLLFQFEYKYDLRVEIKIKDFSAVDIDRKISDKIQKEFVQSKEIVDFVIFAKQDKYSIYFKFKKSFLKKEKAINEIQEKINNIVSEFHNAIIDYDFNFDKKYNWILVVSSPIFDYKNLKKVSNEFIELLISSNSKIKIQPLWEQELIAEVLFDNSISKSTNLTLEDIKKSIINSNLDNNSIYNYKDYFSSNIKLQTQISNVEDIKKITLNLKDKKSSIAFENVFQIKETIKNPEAEIFYNGNIAYIYALRFDKLIDIFKTYQLLNQLKKKYSNIYKFKVLNLNLVNMEKYTYRNKAIDFDEEKIYLFNAPMVNDAFFEKENAKLIILSKGVNFKNNKPRWICDKNLDDLYNTILKKELKVFGVRKTFIEKYEIDNNLLDKYNLQKKDVLNSIFAYNSGLYCTKYFDNTLEVSIYLRNNNDNGFIYSNKYDILIPIEAIAKKAIQYDYSEIIRKNGNFCAIIDNTKALQ